MSANVFSIAVGQNFLKSFAQAFRAGEILPGLDDPLALAKTRIFLPTRRAAKALGIELRHAYGGKALLLPQLLPLGSLDEATLGAFDLSNEDFTLGEDLPPAIGPIERRMVLARLVLAWAQALPHAIVRIGPDGKPEHDESEALLVADNWAAAWKLSADLAGLIDETLIEGIAWERFDDLGADYDAYWRITTEFLQIAMRHWPQFLTDRGLIDAAMRRNLAIERQIEAVAVAKDPIIALGSTGSNRATAKLLAAIAHAPKGAVILPGLDFDLDDASFATIAASAIAGSGEPGHPQAMLARLLPILQVSRADVRPLGSLSAAMTARMRFVSQAMRPAGTSEQWLDWRKAGHEPALHDIALIEAQDEREEALALALVLRQTLETPGRTAALITPDRALSTRVRAELQRWQIEIDDSGGTSLALSPQGLLAQLTLDMVRDGNAIALIALLHDPLLRLGLNRGEAQRLAPLIEIGLLRTVLPPVDWDDIAPWIAAAQDNAALPHAHPALARIKAEDWCAMGALIRKLAEALGPLRQQKQKGDAPLRLWLDLHRAALIDLQQGADDNPPEREDGAVALNEIFVALSQAAQDMPVLGLHHYALFFAEVLSEAMIHEGQRSHPRLKILGLLEARLLQADVVLLAGLDEGIWPPQPQSDAFLNRPMRQSLGLSTPERRIGQSAHDFMHAMGQSQVILSHAKKRDGAPTVPSRFLLRLKALAGDDWKHCQAAGQSYLELARHIDLPDKISPAKSPEPRPAPNLRPNRLSVTQIQTLRYDPYAIYADKTLKLKPLDPIGIALGAREVGTLMHELLSQFVRRFGADPLPDGADAILTQMAEAQFAPLLEDAEFRALQWPMVLKQLRYYLDFERERRPDCALIETERSGALSISRKDGSSFELTARADRIEKDRSGAYHLIDFKTGATPLPKWIRAGFYPQLTLEAAILQNGQFEGLPPQGKAASALYVKLGGKEGGNTTSVKSATMSFEQLSKTHLEQLRLLLDQLQQAETAFRSYPFGQFLPTHSAYDHLARVKEWAGAGSEE